MNKYIDADKLIAEIERLGKNWDGVQELQPASLFQADLYELLSIITSLQQEQPDVGLEKEMKEYLGENWKDGTPIEVQDDMIKFARHFWTKGF